MADNPVNLVLSFDNEADKLEVLRILERGLIALDSKDPVVRQVYAAIISGLPAEEIAKSMEETILPTSLTSKIEFRLRQMGIQTTVWAPIASNGEYTYQAINAGHTNLSLDAIGSYLSQCPELGPITCERSGKHGEHLMLHLKVGGG